MPDLSSQALGLALLHRRVQDSPVQSHSSSEWGWPPADQWTTEGCCTFRMRQGEPKSVRGGLHELKETCPLKYFSQSDVLFASPFAGIGGILSDLQVIIMPRRSNKRVWQWHAAEQRVHSWIAIERLQLIGNNLEKSG